MKLNFKGIWVSEKDAKSIARESKKDLSTCESRLRMSYGIEVLEFRLSGIV